MSKLLNFKPQIDNAFRISPLKKRKFIFHKSPLWRMSCQNEQERKTIQHYYKNHVQILTQYKILPFLGWSIIGHLHNRPLAIRLPLYRVSLLQLLSSITGLRPRGCNGCADRFNACLVQIIQYYCLCRVIIGLAVA